MGSVEPLEREARMNTVTLIGTLTKDPEVRNGSGDAKICSMRIAESNGRKGNALFINVAAFGRQAETCQKYLAKGRQVAVAGQLRFREWEPEGGGKRSEHTIAADRVDFLPGGKGRGSGGGGGGNGAEGGGSGEDRGGGGGEESF
jgi:single-strand DNA-binding protein